MPRGIRSTMDPCLRFIRGPVSALAAVILAPLILAVPAAAEPVAQTWNANPGFDGAPPTGWHREHYQWAPDDSCDGGLDEADFWWGSGTAGAYGKHPSVQLGCYGVAAYRQGNTWDDGWDPNDPADLAPLEIRGRQLRLDTTLRRLDDGDTASWYNGRTMYAVNLWFNSPELSKRLVMDIVFSVGPGDCWASFTDGDAYHYQWHVPYGSGGGCAGEHALAKGEWYTATMDVGEHARRALCDVDACQAWDTLRLEEVSVLVELQEAWAKFEVDELEVRYG